MTTPGTLPERFLDDVRAHADIVGVVSRVVKLTKAGRGEHKGLCPFHGEKTPSFTVSEDKGFFHCFGCQASGDVIDFVQRTENLSFREAVESLASSVGLEVPRPAPRDAAAARWVEDLHAVAEMAARWFQARLRDPHDGAAAVRYLRGRGLDGRTALHWRLGWAPRRGGLMAHLSRQGVTEAVMEAAGLVRRRDDGSVREVFVDRVVFPICDARGRVVGFGGRVIGPDQDGRPKYLNTPDCAIFHKGTLLYGLHHARAPSRAAGRVVCVEGYLDVIACHQAGLAEVVAPLGTAITPEQLAALWRVAPEVVLCLDGDAAGLRAAARACERALPIAKNANDVRVCRLPPGRDADDMARGDPAGLRAALAGAVPSEAVLVEHVAAGRVLDSAARWHGLAEDLEALAATVEDAGRRAAVREAFADRLCRLRAGTRAGRAGALPTARRVPDLYDVQRFAVERLTDAGFAMLVDRFGVSEDDAYRAGSVGAVWVREAERGTGIMQLADRRVQDDAFGAFVMPVLPAPLDWPRVELARADPTLPLADLVAWDMADPWRWLTARGAEPWLGRAAVEAARAEGGALTLHPHPLSWLRGGCRGAVWLPGRVSVAGVESLRAALDGVGRVICAGGHDHAEIVDKALRLSAKRAPPPGVGFLVTEEAEA